MKNHTFELKSLIESTDNGGLVYTDLDLFKTMLDIQLCSGSHKMLSLPNAGGSSVVSEAMSCELLHRCYGAQLIKTEMEVQYWPEGGSITDYTCEIFGTHLGVSVTRAMSYHTDFTSDQASHLLNKKLSGVNQSSQNSMDKWAKQILHVWAMSYEIAHVTVRAYEHIAPDLAGNTIVLITVASNAKEIFQNT